MHSTAKNPIVRVGIIGCGEITQIAHIPTLAFLSDWFQVTYLCDVSNDALRHCQQKVIAHVPNTTRDPTELCSSPDVDLVLVANSDEYHSAHAVLALQHNKNVFVEKPMALNQRDADAVIEAEKKSSGKLMVGYMRRYAAGFVDALKEIGGMDKVSYARFRDIIGPNSAFVNQSGTYPKRFNDFRPEDTKDKDERAADIVAQALSIDCGVSITRESTRTWRLLGGLGSHDLSAMREVLGMPIGVVGASLGFPVLSVLFQYQGFCVYYECALDNIPRFDAHIEVYSSDKSVRVQYDTPYVKGLPTTMHMAENLNGVYKESLVRSTYEDAYTLEMKELYELVAHGKPVKTTAEDAAEDLQIFQMIMRAGYPRASANGHANGVASNGI